MLVEVLSEGLASALKVVLGRKGQGIRVRAVVVCSPHTVIPFCKDEYGQSCFLKTKSPRAVGIKLLAKHVTGELSKLGLRCRGSFVFR